MRMLASLAILPAALLILGCGGSHTYAPVAGMVTLNGEPLSGASVEFQPIPANKGENPGSGSMAITDKEGKFTLRSQLEDKDGAILGKHQVRIYVYDTGPPGAADLDADSTNKKPKGPFVPPRYNSATELTVEVPAAGLSDYHFDLKNP